MSRKLWACGADANGQLLDYEEADLSQIAELGVDEICRQIRAFFPTHSVIVKLSLWDCYEEGWDRVPEPDYHCEVEIFDGKEYTEAAESTCGVSMLAVAAAMLVGLQRKTVGLKPWVKVADPKEGT